MPVPTSHGHAPMKRYSVTKRLAAHQAKFQSEDEIEFQNTPTRSTRNTRHVSYAESDDDEDEEEDDDYTKPDEDSDSDIEEISSQEYEAVVAAVKRTSVSRAIVEGTSGKLFKNMATEIHQLIADVLPSDYDVASYALVCRTTGAAVTSSVWRKRFLRTFDFDNSLETAEMLKKYKYRRTVSKQWTCFDLDKYGGGSSSYEVQEFQTVNQEHSLRMFRGLIIDSNASMVPDENGQLVPHGLNLKFIQDMITGNNGMSYVDIIESVFCTKYDKDIGRNLNNVMRLDKQGCALYNVQLCLSALSLHPNYCNAKVSHFDISQHQVYSAPCTQPLFLDNLKQSVNTRWLLHIVNFFKFHFKSGAEGLLAHAYSVLDADQYPQFWVGKLQAGTQTFGTHWKGAYMYLDQRTLMSSRSKNTSRGTVHTDSLDGGETFQDMSFFFDDAQYGTDKWPKQWERILGSDPFKELGNLRTRYRRNQPERPAIKQFWGTSRGSKQGHFFGRIHAMAPQADIPGFQRLVMMKFYTKKENGEQVYDPTQVWAYEGVVLPGRRIVVGRWWDARGDIDDERINSGPFIWWNVDRSGAAKPIDKDEAFDFLDSFQDHDLGVV